MFEAHTSAPRSGSGYRFYACPGNVPRKFAGGGPHENEAVRLLDSAQLTIQPLRFSTIAYNSPPGAHVEIRDASGEKASSLPIWRQDNSSRRKAFGWDGINFSRKNLCRVGISGLKHSRTVYLQGEPVDVPKISWQRPSRAEGRRRVAHDWTQNAPALVDSRSSAS